MDATRQKFLVAGAILCALLAAALVLSPMAGSVWVGPRELLHALLGYGDNVTVSIVMKSRIPRTLLALFAGAGLAVSGAVLQALLKNPLADPFTLGVASGGALGAALVILLGAGTSFLGVSLLSAASMAGSVLTLLLILAAARRVGLGSGSIILAGISINIIVTSAILFLQYLSDIAQSHLIVRWLMGELDVWGTSQVLPVAAVVTPGVAAGIFLSGRLNHLMTGELLAAARGIEVRKVFAAGVVATSLMTGAIVAVCGPLAFVGLIVPHIVRSFAGYDNRLVLPLSALAGALLLIVCDGVARTVVAPGEIPVGVITSILGGTTLVVLLLLRRRSMGM
jgi:iron complex transport system permease protein